MDSSYTKTSAPEPSPESVRAESQRHIAEARRAEIECRKIELEALEIEKRLNVPWYHGRLFLQATVGAIIASSLLAAWLITYMQPILNRKQEIASLDATIQARTNERQRLENERRTEILEQENKSIRDQLASLSKLNSSLREQQEEVERRATALQQTLVAQAAELRRLATQTPTSSSETQRLGQLAQKAQAESENVQQQIAALRLDHSVSETRAQDIATSITANALRDTTWRIVCPGPDCSTNLLENFVRLRGDGAMGYNNTKPSDFTFDGTDSWKVLDGHLVLTWSNGYSTDTFTLPTPTSSKAQGKKSNVASPLSIEKVQ